MFAPEAAPLLFQAGLDGRKKRFQRAVVHLQIALEDSCAEAAHPGQIILCHRGTLDPLAYWLRNGWLEQEFFAFTGLKRDQYLQRYAGVIHMQTAATGAEAYYRRWPDAHRPETIAQAVETDRLCAHAWGGHPYYVLIENSGRDWHAKAQAVRDVLTCWLA